MSQHYVYHPNYEPAIAETDEEYNKLLGMGWSDSPAKFPVIETAIIMPVPCETVVIDSIKIDGNIIGSVPENKELDITDEIKRKPGRPPKLQSV